MRRSIIRFGATCAVASVGMCATVAACGDERPRRTDSEASPTTAKPAIALPPGEHTVRVVVFGPHTDLEAHAAARAAGIGPMMARSKLVTSLAELLVAR